MITKAVQQLMLGKVIKSEEQTAHILDVIKLAGYDGIELNGFMIRPTSLFVRALTAAAGMPAGRGGAFDWAALTKAAGLRVVALHEDLGTLQKDPEAAIQKAKELGTENIVITGMYRFDYTDVAALGTLCTDLNAMGERLKEAGIRLLYHNHNVELCRVQKTGKTAYETILNETDPAVLNFEFDSYWFADGGADAGLWMERLKDRMRLWHINDRGTRLKGTPITPIVKADAMELGYGNMNLHRLTEIAKQNNIEAVVLETHKNHIDGDPIKSLQRSAAYLNRNF